MPLSFSWPLYRSNPLTRAEGGGYIPLADVTRPRISRWKVPRLARSGASTFVAFVLAALAGTFLYFIYFSSNRRLQYVFPLPVVNKTNNTATEHSSIVLDSPIFIPDGEKPSLEQLRSIVGQTKGYWARDYSLHLGWNNVSHCRP